MSGPVYVAIDTPDMERARSIGSAVKRHAGGLKLGLEFFVHNGRQGVMEMADLGLPIFLDLKFHDIPNTVAKAIQAMSPLVPSILTVHAGGGLGIFHHRAAAAPDGTKVVGVTVLTSLDRDDLASVGCKDDQDKQVLRLAALAREAGLDGIVCSGREVASVKAQWKDGFFVVPGVRPMGTASADQKRTVTPRGAMDAGASILVIGRPVTEAENPDEALREIGATL
jgi:orotidine-5'-phosphate decarboxylase